MFSLVLSPDNLAVVAGVVLSLAFSYVPGLGAWYNRQASDVKRVIMLGVLALTCGVIVGLACAGVLSGVECSRPGIIQMVEAFFVALVANQTTDRISPKVGTKV